MNSPVIALHDLTKQYGGTARPALDRLTLSVEAGQILGYLGPNGAGKTTTIRLLLGLITPTDGQALVFGKDALTDAAALHHDMAYIPGETSLWPNLTGAETLRFLANIHGGNDRQYEKELVKKFEFNPNLRVRAYSKGNRQKIALVAALSTRAKLLIMDEPSSGLDPVMAKAFRDEVRVARDNGQTVFLSSHQLEEVEELCDRVAILNNGRLVEQGTLDELRHLSAVTVEATFAGKPPSVSQLKSVSNVEAHEHFLRCNVNGSIDELLAVMAKAKPLSFLSRKPTLEELFLSLYEHDNKRIAQDART